MKKEPARGGAAKAVEKRSARAVDLVYFILERITVYDSGKAGESRAGVDEVEE